MIIRNATEEDVEQIAEIVDVRDRLTVFGQNLFENIHGRGYLLRA